jgi:hypothetical protein
MTTTTTARLTKGDYQNYLQQGISYEQYKQNMAKDLALNEDLKTKEYIHLNQRRMIRVEKNLYSFFRNHQPIKKS